MNTTKTTLKTRPALARVRLDTFYRRLRGLVLSRQHDCLAFHLVLHHRADFLGSVGFARGSQDEELLEALGLAGLSQEEIETGRNARFGDVEPMKADELELFRNGLELGRFEAAATADPDSLCEHLLAIESAER